jgi:hypothetical protein
LEEDLADSHSEVDFIKKKKRKHMRKIQNYTK